MKKLLLAFVLSLAFSSVAFAMDDCVMDQNLVQTCKPVPNGYYPDQVKSTIWDTIVGPWVSPEFDHIGKDNPSCADKIITVWAPEIGRSVRFDFTK